MPVGSGGGIRALVEALPDHHAAELVEAGERGHHPATTPSFVKSPLS